MKASSSSKPSFSCIRCFDRKVKCDRQIPCGACVRHNVQCISRPRKPSRRTRLAKDEVLEERLKLYEAILREEGVDPNRLTGIARVETNHQSTHSKTFESDWLSPTDSNASEPQTTVFRPRLIQGQGGTKFVDNSLWSRLAEEFHESEDTLEDNSADDSYSDVTCHDDFSYVLGPKPPRNVLSHPPTEHIYQLWEAFLDNVNPLSKLVHVPTLQPAIEKAITNIDRIPKGFEALLFAIYSIAVLSLTDDECKEKLGESRAILLPRYVRATRTALTRAGFMSSTSIVTLQALVLHIFSIRDVFEPRAVWSLTGVAIRVAEGMGMRVDGTLLGLSPFETEIRRRIWWQLQMHDFRAAELCGQAKFRNFELGETTPKKPANVNDEDLNPAMSQAAIESTRHTEMMYCMLRSDLASFAAAQKAKMNTSAKITITTEKFSAMDDLKLKDNFIKELEDMIETRYLRFCDPSQPLQLLTLLGGRLSINLIRFIAHHPRRWAKLDQVPLSEQQLVWSITIGLLEKYNMMQSSPMLRRFAWCVPYFVQWHAVIHILDTLRANPLHADATNAWRLIDALYQNNPQMLMSIKKPIFVAVGNLCLRAFTARSAALESQGRNIPNTLDYITKLKEVRKNARTQREAIMARRRGQTDKRSMAVDINTTVLVAKPTPETIAEGPPIYTAMNQSTYPVTGNLRTEDDAFWLSNALQDDFPGEAGNTMYMDTDDVLAQECWLENTNGEGIDWVQWDALVSHVDPGRKTLEPSLDDGLLAR